VIAPEAAPTEVAVRLAERFDEDGLPYALREWLPRMVPAGDARLQLLEDLVHSLASSV